MEKFKERHEEKMVLVVCSGVGGLSYSSSLILQCNSDFTFGVCAARLWMSCAVVFQSWTVFQSLSGWKSQMKKKDFSASASWPAASCSQVLHPSRLSADLTRTLSWTGGRTDHSLLKLKLTVTSQNTSVANYPTFIMI